MYHKCYTYHNYEFPREQITWYDPRLDHRGNDRFFTNFLNNTVGFRCIWMPEAEIFGDVKRPSDIYACTMIVPYTACILWGSDAEEKLTHMCTPTFINARFIISEHFQSRRDEFINHPDREKYIRKNQHNPLYNHVQSDIRVMLRRADFNIAQGDNIAAKIMLKGAKNHVKTLDFPSKIAKYECLEPLYQKLATVSVCLYDPYKSIHNINNYIKLFAKYVKCYDGNDPKQIKILYERADRMITQWKNATNNLIEKRFKNRISYNWSANYFVYNVNSERRDIKIYGHTKIIKYMENAKNERIIIEKIKLKKCALYTCRKLFINHKFGRGGKVLNRSCKNCKSVYYCCFEHQKMHWIWHKNKCNKFNTD